MHESFREENLSIPEQLPYFSSQGNRATNAFVQSGVGSVHGDVWVKDRTVNQLQVTTPNEPFYDKEASGN